MHCHLIERHYVMTGLVSVLFAAVAFLFAIDAASESEGRGISKGKVNPAMITSRNKPLVIAHRGASGYLPEHTLEAVAMAHALGSDSIEQDVVLTRDDVPVVLHDIHLDTVTNVAKVFPDRARDDKRFYAIDFSLAEIKQLSAHERVNLKTGKSVFPLRFDSGKRLFRVPTLAEELSLIQGLNKSRDRDTSVYVEVKAPAWHREQGKDISKIVLRTLDQFGYRVGNDGAYFQCFDPTELRRVREELRCQLKLVQLIGSNRWNEAATDYDRMRTDAGLANVAEYADGIGPWVPHVRKVVDGDATDTGLVKLAHKHGLKVHVYTLRQDSLPDYAKTFSEALDGLIDSGVDGVFTDFPDLMVEHLK